MVVKHTLDNGVTVLVDEMQDVRSFALGFFVRAGSGDEPPARQGLSHFLEHVLFKRTRKRSNVQIARAIDRLGGDVDAFTTKEYTGFYVHTLDTRFADALDLMGDVVLSPAFDASDIEMERGVILEEIGEANDNPDDLVHEMFVSSFWKSHPLGAPILGTAETVRAIGREDLYRYYRSRYAPGNIIVSVAGHVRADEVLAAISRLFRRRTAGRNGAAAKRSGPDRRPQSHQHVRVQSRRGLEQVHVCLGVAGPAQASERRFATGLLDIVLGGGMSSRLFQEVREKRGLAYSIGSSLNSYRLGGYETVSAACAPRNLSRVLDVTLRELRKLKRTGVRPHELEWAKENLKGNLVLALESTVSRMSAAARQEFYFGRSIPPEEWIARVENVKLDDVGEEAERLFDGRVLSLTVVGNVARPPLSEPDLKVAL
ncbi:MAG TPA: pitrilysin family protein [Thermoanaerobaculia bacterium]|jgi:predicted Zn-dependent peptidase|nr:pitrilysin family protein [Thermoanaerobaculia bacterium]